MIVDDIDEAIRQPKYRMNGPDDICWEFARLRENPETDWTKEYVAFLLEASEDGLQFPGLLGESSGKIYCICCRYSDLPAILNDPRVLRVEASVSDPKYILDE